VSVFAFHPGLSAVILTGHLNLLSFKLFGRRFRCGKTDIYTSFTWVFICFWSHYFISPSWSRTSFLGMQVVKCVPCGKGGLHLLSFVGKAAFAL